MGINSNTKVLLVDDEQDILDLLQYNFNKEGYQVQTAINGIEAIEVAKKYMPDVILLDIMMPQMDGVETCRRIRELTDGFLPHIIFLTSRSEEFTEIAAFDAGGNDFIIKPIKPRALLSRVASWIQRKAISGDQNDVVTINNMTVDRAKYLVTIDDKNLNFPKKEFELLFYLATNPNRVIGRDELLSQIWGADVCVIARTVDVHVTKVRQKIGDNLIKTIKGVGYKFEA